jgi:dihydrofolate reductase
MKENKMRKLIVLSFISLDGVMQGPGAPEEDPTGGFKYEGWVAGYFDDFLGKVMDKQVSKPFDLLLGRKTYEIFAAHWPYVSSSKDPFAARFNKAKKYVVSKTLTKLDWSNSELVKGDDILKEIKRIKEQDGPEIQIYGSGNLLQTLLKHDLVDELWLKIFSVTLGRGKRLFAEGTIPAEFKLLEGAISPSGVIIASYERAGEVKTGSFGGPETPSAAELARRKRLKEEG